mmetsp:Transcript_26255/g.56904  ORF Transcript_26255/g.56904 Transcript_26255/m.56904 type:complete len:975 (-) Transcript_26255:79-3003(-)
MTESQGANAATTVDTSIDTRTTSPSDQDAPTDKLVIEIVSCWDLPAEDFKSSDPYVKVRRSGHREYIHETKHIPNTLNPIFTVKTGNLFVVPKKDVQAAGKLLFKVKEYDRISITNETLGSVEIDADTLLKAKGERMEFDLTRKKKKSKGHIAIRCREAKRYDVRFVEELSKGKDSVDLQAFSSADKKLMKTHGGVGITNVTKVIKAHHRTDHVTKEKKYRIRPYPDPDRPEEATKWMSHDDIVSGAMNDSRNWLDIGSGTLGRVYLEIIGIDDMINMDEVMPISGVGKSNKTDSFVAVIYEDCIAKTDVIDDCLNPRWMPWMQRAFVLRTMYPNSQLFLGVFDYDSGAQNEHDMVGRVSVNLTDFRPGSEYLLHYHLFKSAKIGPRKPRGTLIIRMKIEADDERQNIIKNLSPPPSIYVSCRNISDFRIARKTVTGKTDVEVYSTKTLNAYVDELQAYKYMSHYMKEACVNLLFWRGTYPIRITKNFSFLLPLHSMTAFLTGVLFAERPTLAPSFFMFGVSWVLFAVQGYRQKSPNPWDRCRSYTEMAQMLIQGVCVLPPPSIEPHQDEEEALKYEEMWNKRIADAEEAAAKRNEEFQKQQAEYEQHVSEVGDATAETDISSKNHGRIPGHSAVKMVTNLNPMKMILYPIQIYLGIACDWLRFVKNVVIWEECYVSFIVTTTSLVLGFVFLFVPWYFLIRWTIRLLVWLGLGPWMKLADKYWYSKLEGLSEEEKKEKMKSMLQARKKQAEVSAKDARIAEEEAYKLKAMKTMLYGDYLTKVPVRNTDRFRDIPLHASSATPEHNITRVQSRAIASVERVGGQHIDTSDGMVPKIKPPRAIAGSPSKITRVSKSASKRMMARVVFFFVVLPLLLTAGWFAVPYVSSRLPEIPIAHTVGLGIAGAKNRFFSGRDKVEKADEEASHATKKIERKSKKRKPMTTTSSNKTSEEEGCSDGGYLQNARKLISRLTSFFA